MIKINDMCFLQDEYISLAWNPYTKKHYQSKGYVYTKCGEVFKCKVVDLMRNSPQAIGVICPVCGKEYQTQFRKTLRENKQKIGMNTICSSGCFKKHLHKDDECFECKKTNVIFRYFKGKQLCGKCYSQMKRLGRLYKNILEPNDVNIMADYVEIILRDSCGKEVARTKIDKEDLDKVKNIKWRLGANGYIYGMGGDNNSVKLHRFIMGVDSADYDVDHVYYDRLDNRKKYLRILTQSENRSHSRKKQDYIIRMSGIKKYATEDGVGIRTSIYTCMCSHRCQGCHNKETWDYVNGYNSTVQELFDVIVSNPHGGVTFSGGEPFLQWKQLFYLAIKIKENTDKNIWIYSGYTFEELIKDDEKRLLLEKCDVLVDGRFVEEFKDLRLKFRGSTNQRLINVQETLKRGEVVLWDTSST